MQCPYCRKEIDDNSKQCEFCGAVMPVKPAANRRSSSSSGSSYSNNRSSAYRPSEAEYRYNRQVNALNQNTSQAGKGQAIASLVLGIIGIVFWFFGYSSVVSVILGIIGLILAGASKNAGYTGGARTAGFVLSLLSLIFGALILIACVACVGAIQSEMSTY